MKENNYNQRTTGIEFDDHQTLRTRTNVSAGATLDRVEYVEHWTQYRVPNL